MDTYEKKVFYFSKGHAGNEAMRKKNCVVARDPHRIDPIMVWLQCFLAELNIV